MTAATLLVSGIIMAEPGATGLKIPAAVFAASLFIALVGFIDDVKPIPVLPRLLLQAAAVALGAVLVAASRRSAHLPKLPARHRARPALDRRPSGWSISSTSWTDWI